MKRVGLFRRMREFGADRIVLGAAVASLALALLGPSVRLAHHVYHYMFVIDITQSMNTTDYELNGRRVSRLAYAKAAVKRAIAELPCGSKAGLGVFTEHRSMLLLLPVETCTGYGELTATLERVDWRMGWAGASEVAKGLYSAIRLVRTLDPKPDLVFLTDGHEAPPLHPRHHPIFNGTPGEVRGLIVGTGGLAPAPIPKFDMAGNPLGFWRADEVLQTDVYSQGRSASVAREAMVDSAGARVAKTRRSGGEHFSSLKEEYLQELVRTTQLGYRRLTGLEVLTGALLDRTRARSEVVATDLGPAFATLALFCLVWVYGAGMFMRHTGAVIAAFRKRSGTRRI